MTRLRILLSLLTALLAAAALTPAHAAAPRSGVLSVADPAGDAGPAGYWRSELAAVGSSPQHDIVKLDISTYRDGARKMLKTAMTLGGVPNNGSYDVTFDVPGCEGPPPPFGGIAAPTVPVPPVTDEHTTGGFYLRAGPSLVEPFTQTYGICLAAGPNNQKMLPAIFTIKGNTITTVIEQSDLLKTGTVLKNITAQTSPSFGSSTSDFATTPEAYKLT